MLCHGSRREVVTRRCETVARGNSQHQDTTKMFFLKGDLPTAGIVAALATGIATAALVRGSAIVKGVKSLRRAKSATAIARGGHMMLLASAPERPPAQLTREVLCLSGMSELVDMYDGFTLDQYGVMHDGQTAYEGASACLEKLHASGKPTVILSNYPGRAEAQRARLPSIGFDPEHATAVITSGELAHRYLDVTGRKLGTRVIWISESNGKGRLDGYFDGLDGFTLSSDVNAADFILVSDVGSIFAGTEKEKTTDFERDGNTSPFSELFLQAIGRGLPLLCANPDMRVVRPGGWQAFCGGFLAEHYKQLGGHVEYFGKPFKSSFEEARRIVSEVAGIDDPKICHVGDSLSSDVAGAMNAGFDAAFVYGTGLFAGRLVNPAEVDVKQLCRLEEAPTPAVVVPRFAW